VSPEHALHAAPPAAGGAEADGGTLAEFRAFRERMNAEILAEGNLVVNRFFALDGRAYEAGALDVRTKELLGLVASLVLRCDDCITYHVIRCREEGVTARGGVRGDVGRAGRGREHRDPALPARRGAVVGGGGPGLTGPPRC